MANNVRPEDSRKDERTVHRTEDSPSAILSSLPEELARKISGLPPAQRALLEIRLKERMTAETATPLTPQPRPEFIPLSFAQQRLWFLDQLQPANPVYIISRAFRLTGRLDGSALQRALDALVARHEVLRTVYEHHPAGPYQRIMPAGGAPRRDIDLTGIPAGERLAEARRRLRDESRRPFDLQRDVMLRAVLARLGEDDHILLLVTHHIASDGWSLAVLYDELGCLYRAFTGNVTPELPELPVQYADFAIWQRQRLSGRILDDQLGYWRRRLTPLPPPVELPMARPRPAMQTVDGACEYMTVPADLAAELGRVAVHHGATFFMLLLAAFKVLLFRYTRQPDLCVGTPVANRTRSEIEPLMGFFVNTLAIRSALRDDMPFTELLGEIRESAINAYDHQELPFEKLVSELQPDRDLSRNPIFQVMFALLNTSIENLQLSGLAVTPMWLHRGTAVFDLSCFLEMRGKTITGFMEYNTDLFDAAIIRRMAGHYLELLHGIAADPACTIGRLPLLSPDERRQILVDWNDTAAPGPAMASIADVVVDTAARTPDHPAVISPEGEIPYARLVITADRLAACLRRQGIGPGDRVGLRLQRSGHLPAFVLGVLRAGAACVPLDPDYPPRRLAFMASDARLKLIIRQSGHRPTPEDFAAACPVVEMADIRAAAADIAAGSPPGDSAADSLAYILYTSGSTGTPKGVAMPHGPLVNLIRWQTGQPLFRPGARVLQFASLSFDVAFQEMFSTWASGGTLVMIDEQSRRDPEKLLEFLTENTIQRLFLPYVALQQLAETAVHHGKFPAPLTEVITAGETLRTTPAIREFFRQLPGCRLENQYGPTETHVVSSFPLVGPVDAWPALPPIGRPIANAQLYVLDPLRQPLPVGVPGELTIGGSPLARGYFENPARTQEVFVPDPFAAEPDAVMYRTGDVAVFREDGVIQFRGRTDRQLKIRGFRIEPAEIEIRLNEHAAVSDCAVVAVPDGNDGLSLAAHLVLSGDPGPSTADLRAWLAAALPPHMIPAAFHRVPELPRTASGKIDRRALVEVSGDERPEPVIAGQDFTSLERTIAEVWQETLGCTVRSPNDNFFDLGGHSLLAVVLIRHLEKRLDRDLPVSMLFEAPTVARQARYLENRTRRHAWQLSLVEIKPEGERPPLFCIHSYGGYVINYRSLAELLPPNQPLWGIRAPRTTDGFIHFESLEHLASFYINELCSRFPDGPYLLAGYSSGGVIAFEMGRQMAARGLVVPFIGLLDTCMLRSELRPNRLCHPGMWWNFFKNIPFWMLELLRGSAGEGQGNTEPVRGRVRQVTGRDRYDWMRDVREERREFAFRHLDVLQRYTPAACDLHVHVFRSRARGLLHPQTTDLGWARYARGGVTVHHIRGRHAAMLREPAVSDLAGQLPAAMAQALEAIGSPWPLQDLG